MHTIATMASPAAPSSPSSADTWDAIVIGAGIGGLSAGAAHANAGKRVLVLERQPEFGGAASVYRHGSLTVEASLHEIDGDTVFGPNGPFVRLGLADAVRPIGLDPFCEVRGGPLQLPVVVPHGFDAAQAALCAALPDAGQQLQRWFADMRQLHSALTGLEGLGSHGFAGLAGFLFSGGIWEMVSDLRQTVATRFEHAFGSHETAKLVVGALLGYFDDDPAKLSFLLYGGVWGRYLHSRGHYFHGGSRAVTAALHKRIGQAGGQARPHCAVTDVLLDDKGAACGVRYTQADGTPRSAYAPVVFANAAPVALAEMLPPERRAAFVQPYADFEPSVSLFNVSLGLSRPASDFGVGAYSTFVYPDDMTHFGQYPELAARLGRPPGQGLPPYTIADYGRLDAGLRQPADPYLLSICGIDRLAWGADRDAAADQAHRRQWIDVLVADMDRRFPGFASAVTTAEIATARTMKRFLGTPSGEVYGFRPTPQRLFAHPPSAATTIAGLYLSSAYTVSGGYAGAMQGGLMASDRALRR